MSFTFVGMIQLIVGMLLLVRPVHAMIYFVLVSGLFGGAAAVTVTAIGNSSIPPIQFALLFVYLRLLMPRGGYFSMLGEAVRTNLLMVLFTLYGMAAAYAAPRIFAGQMNVAPLRFENARNLFDTVPLHPTPQNLTASIYLLGGLLLLLATYAICRARGGIEAFVPGMIWVTVIHAFSGVIAAATHGTAMDEVFGLFRNGSYAQLDQSYQGFARIDGFFPEASGYAAFGLSCFVFMAECWYRSILPRPAGQAALLMGAVLFFSTSSTAYVGLGCYFAFFVARAAIVPGLARPGRLKQAALALFAMVVIAALAMVLVPGLTAQVTDMLLHMTVEKRDSESGRQRLFWAMQGFEAFAVSGGLGIGPGSFRSSSLFTAILGTMGVIGMGTFLAYVAALLRPLPRHIGVDRGDGPTAVMGACATTAAMILVPAAISSPNSHPGTGFAMFAGAALAMRQVIVMRYRLTGGASRAAAKASDFARTPRARPSSSVSGPVRRPSATHSSPSTDR